MSRPFGKLFQIAQKIRETIVNKSNPKHYWIVAGVDLSCIILILVLGLQPAAQLVSPLISGSNNLRSLEHGKSGYEVFGFAPFWTINKLDNVDFNVLTTLAYFGIPVLANGNLDTSDHGYDVFKSDKATELFKKAHQHGTRVVLTITQMNSSTIKTILDDPQAQQKTIDQTVAQVKNRGIDGVNIDFEYSGNPGDSYRHRFSEFAKNLTDRMHSEVPNSRVTVSVYAASAKSPKMYDIQALGQHTDGIFMMAYDFAVAGSDNAIPTAPLYGHKSGKYWYDISTAVDDFLKVMPANKLILGVPYYGYNYMVKEPTVKATTLPTPSWRGRAYAQTYAISSTEVSNQMEGISEFTSGWDDEGKVGYKAYRLASNGIWRMVFEEDQRSLSIKYDFAKEKNLAGVGMWALGFDDGKSELWRLLSEKFGMKLADNQITSKEIYR